jgi:hypothetical protein
MKFSNAVHQWFKSIRRALQRNDFLFEAPHSVHLAIQPRRDVSLEDFQANHHVSQLRDALFQILKPSWRCPQCGRRIHQRTPARAQAADNSHALISSNGFRLFAVLFLAHWLVSRFKKTSADQQTRIQDSGYGLILKLCD